MESKVFSLFQISLENFFKTKFYLAHHLRLQPSEIDSLPYYEYWYYVKHLSDHLKEQDKERRKEQDGQNAQYEQISSMTKQSQPKMPNMGNFGSGFGGVKAPSVKMPRL